jgi:hypothetical protein
MARRGGGFTVGVEHERAARVAATLPTPRRTIVSREVFTQVFDRARTDAAFREQLRHNPKGALAGYDLTSAERSALAATEAPTLRIPGRVIDVEPARESAA